MIEIPHANDLCDARDKDSKIKASRVFVAVFTGILESSTP